MPNQIIVKKDGPLVINGKVEIIDSAGSQLVFVEDTSKDEAVYLCRCGASKNKPFCDGEHKRCNFTDDASINDAKQEVIVEPSDTLSVSIRKGAMYIVKSGVIIENEDATSQTTRNKVALCRCGASNNKPFCDGSHSGNNFDD